jgi:tetratricopeptide (TPR) repeat protein
MKNSIIITFLFLFCFMVKIFGQTELPTINDLMQKGNYTEALVVLEKLNVGDSTQTDVLQKQALCNLKLGRTNQARKLYQALLLRNPDSIDNLMQLTTVYEKEYNLLSAIKTCQKLNALDTLNIFYLKELARLSIRMEHPQEAIPYLKKAISIDNQDIESLTSLANLYLNRAEHCLASPLIETAFLLDSSSVRVRHLRSRLSYVSFNYQGVVGDILFTMSLGDSTTYYQRLLGRAYYYLDSLNKSVATFKRLINIGEKAENIYAGLAFAQLRLGKGKDDIIVLSEANNNFNKAIEEGTSNQIPDYKLGIADVNDKLGDTEYAIRLFRELMTTRPKALVRLGEIYEIKKQDKDLAILHYQEYIKACGKQKTSTLDCKFVETAQKRIDYLNKSLKINTLMEVLTQDSVKTELDTTRHDEK